MGIIRKEMIRFQKINRENIAKKMFLKEAIAKYLLPFELLDVILTPDYG